MDGFDLYEMRQRSLPFDHVIEGGLFREQKRELEPELPIPSVSRVDDVIKSLDRRIERLFIDLEHPAKTTTYRDRPLLAGRCRPVRCDDGRSGQVPTFGHIIVDEGL